MRLSERIAATTLVWLAFMIAPTVWAEDLIVEGNVVATTNVVAHQAISAKRLAVGSNALANVDYSVAEGSSVANGPFSHAEGDWSFTYGTASHAEGYHGWTYGHYAHAEGKSCTAYDTGSHAEGGNTSAHGDYSHAEGEWSSASGVGAHAEGCSTWANGRGAHTEGLSTSTYDADGAHVEGEFSMVLGRGAHAEGFATMVGGDYGHAEGYFSSAPGDYSHAEGRSSSAGGLASHAAGDSAKALHDNTYVWSDDPSDWEDVSFTSTTHNEFSVRARNGVRFVTGPGGVTVNGFELAKLAYIPPQGDLSMGSFTNGQPPQ